MQPLTPKQLQVYESIEKAIAAAQPAPTLRELCARFRWASTASARDHLNALVRKGYIIPAKGRARGYRLARGVETADFVPLLGQVPAGVPFDAVESVERQLAVPWPVSQALPSFALRVTGTSMLGAAIEAGDIIFVRKQETAEVGEIVVARVGDYSDVTVKRFGRVKGREALIPENPAFRTILIDARIAIIGIVVGLVRDYARRSPRAR